MPSAMTSSSVSRPYVYAMRSWLTLREPLRDSWKMVKRIRPDGSAAPCLPTALRWCAALARRASCADFREQHALQVAEERQLALAGRNVADRLLQCEHRLRPLQRVEAQAPVDDLEHVLGILTRPDLLRRHQVVFLHARVGCLRRERRETREHAGARTVDVGPRAEALRVAVLLGCGEARRVHRRELRARVGERLPCRAEVEQHRRAIGAQVDVGRLDVEVQELVRVHFAQAVEQMHEHVAHEALGHLVLAHLDLLLQRAPALVAHHHVHRLVGAEEIEHAHDVRMVDLGERAALLEETLHPVAERREILGGARAHDVALGAQHQRRRQVFLDGHRRAGLVERTVDDRKPTAADLPVDPVVEQLVAGRKCLVGDGHGLKSRTIAPDLSQFTCQVPPSTCAGCDIAHTVAARGSQNPAKGRGYAPIAPKTAQIEPFPMILSMTGFAALSAELSGAALSVELRSVNHRYLDLTLRLPDELRAQETALRERIAAELKRGKVECRVGLARNPAAAGSLAVDTRRVVELAAAAANVQGLAPGSAPISVAEILRWPGVIADASVPPDVLAAKLQELVTQALADPAR